MAKKPRPERKGSLTFEEKITAAYLHYCQGVDQHVIATAMLVNQGRVAEACTIVRRALTAREPTAKKRGNGTTTVAEANAHG